MHKHPHTHSHVCAFTHACCTGGNHHRGCVPSCLCCCCVPRIVFSSIPCSHVNGLQAFIVTIALVCCAWNTIVHQHLPSCLLQASIITCTCTLPCCVYSSDDFYNAFLGNTMVYTSGIRETETDTLQDMQLAKVCSNLSAPSPPPFLPSPCCLLLKCSSEIPCLMQSYVHTKYFF
jgi:hypothetical protein